jgi:hypothetical protein
MADIQARIGPALVDFAAKGHYPDDAVAGAQLEASGLPEAYKTLDRAKSELEVWKIHSLNVQSPIE